MSKLKVFRRHPEFYVAWLGKRLVFRLFNKYNLIISSSSNSDSFLNIISHLTQDSAYNNLISQKRGNYCCLDSH